MSDQPHFDNIRAEKQELDTLIERGMTFTVPVRSILRYLGKTERSFIIRQPYLGTLDYLSREFIDMDFSEEKLQGNAMGESKRLIAHNARRCARVIAIAILNSKWRIKLLAPLLASYLLWRITPDKLFKLTLLINTISNVADFTNSIRFLSVTRTTSPALMEKKPEIAPVIQPG